MGDSDILYSEYVQLLNLVGVSSTTKYERTYSSQHFDRKKGRFANNLRRKVKLRAVIPTKDEGAFDPGNLTYVSDDDQSHCTADELEISNISIPSILKTSKHRPKSAAATPVMRTDSDLMMKKSVTYMESTPQTDRPSHDPISTEKRKEKIKIRLDKDGIPLFTKESLGKDRFLQCMKERDDKEAAEAMRRKRLGSNRNFIEKGYILMKEGVPYVYDDHGFLVPKKDYKPHEKVDHGRRKKAHNEAPFFRGNIIKKTQAQIEAKKKNLVELNTDVVWRPLCLPASSFLPKDLRSRAQKNVWAEKTTSILRQTVSTGKTIPLSFVRQWNEYNHMENLDCIITIEYCCDCASHDFNTRHDEFLYLNQLRKALEVLCDIVANFAVRVAILPKATSRCGFIVPELKYSNQQTNSNTSKDSYEYLMEEYIDYSKRYGAFEVQIGLKKANGEFIAHILHSKLFRGCWPGKKSLRLQCQSLFHEAGIRTLSTPITRDQFNPSAHQLPAEEGGAVQRIQYCFDARFDNCIEQEESVTVSRSTSPMKHESVIPFAVAQDVFAKMPSPEEQEELHLAVEAETRARLVVEEELLEMRERQRLVEDENARLRAEVDRQRATQDEAARQKAIAEGEAARERAVSEEAVARQKAIAEEATRQRAIAEEEAARQKAIVEEAVTRQRAIAEEATRQKAIAEEAVARQKAVAEEGATRQKAIAEEAVARQKAVAEEAARQKAIAEDEARQRAVAVEAVAKQKAIAEDEARQRAVAVEAAARQKAVAEEEAARQRAVAEDEARQKAIAGEAARQKAIEEEKAEQTRLEQEQNKKMKSHLKEQAEHAIELAFEMHVFSDINDLVRCRQLDNARILLDKFPAKVHLKDENGWTPLHWACYLGYREGAVMLIEHGACLADDRNADGATALDLARVKDGDFAKEIEAMAVRFVGPNSQADYDDDFEEVCDTFRSENNDEDSSLKVDSSKIANTLPAAELTRRMTALKIMINEDVTMDGDDGDFLDDDEFFDKLEFE